MKFKQKTIVNEHGQKTHIRITIPPGFDFNDFFGKEISIYQEDTSDEFITISEFLCDMNANENELISIYNSIKELVIQEDFIYKP